MGNSNYRKGASLERRIKAKFEALGLYVMRSAGSHGIADLAVFGPGAVALIQCKTGKAKTSKADCDELLRLSRSAWALPYVYERGQFRQIHNEYGLWSITTAEAIAKALREVR